MAEPESEVLMKLSKISNSHLNVFWLKKKQQQGGKRLQFAIAQFRRCKRDNSRTQPRHLVSVADKS